MTIDTDDDRAVFLADFGKVVTYTRANRAPVTLTAQFDKPADVSSQFNEAPGLMVNKPQIIARTRDLPADAADGDAVSVAGEPTSYRVSALYPDGQGFTRVELRAAS